MSVWISNFSPRPLLTLRAALIAIPLLLLSCTEDPAGSVQPSSDGGSRLAFSPPAQVLAVRAIDRNELTVEVRLNAVNGAGGILVPMTRDSDGNWVGNATVTANQMAVITVSWFFNGLMVAQAEKDLSVSGSGADVDFVSSDFDTRIDSDGDSQSNLDELDAGTDPQDSSDPPPPGSPFEPVDPDTTPPENDPCEISIFDSACTNDTDNDGITDFMEGEFTDSDNDSIPDYQESTAVDADMDGFNAQEDVNEEDACSPSNQVEACQILFRDTDGDGLLDVEEGTLDTDMDGKLDFTESRFDDTDGDGTNNQLDPDDNDPCIPSLTGNNCPQ